MKYYFKKKEMISTTKTVSNPFVTIEMVVILPALEEQSKALLVPIAWEEDPKLKPTKTSSLSLNSLISSGPKVAPTIPVTTTIDIVIGICSLTPNIADTSLAITVVIPLGNSDRFKLGIKVWTETIGNENTPFVRAFDTGHNSSEWVYIKEIKYK